jgi:hypothetical protein
LWHLLLTLFDYDHTLEEGGVEQVGTFHTLVGQSLAGSKFRLQSPPSEEEFFLW